MFDYEYYKDDFVWNKIIETWDATDGQDFDAMHPRLAGLIVDDFLDICGSGGTSRYCMVIVTSEDMNTQTISEFMYRHGLSQRWELSVETVL